eukprot:8265263-Karenia_brevis.AAC.1
MNIIPSNHIQETVEGDMASLPNDSQWRCITMRSGETLRWSAADLKCCFYVLRLPPAWRQWMVFERPVPRSALGLVGADEIWLCSL